MQICSTLSIVLRWDSIALCSTAVAVWNRKAIESIESTIINTGRYRFSLFFVLYDDRRILTVAGAAQRVQVYDRKRRTRTPPQFRPVRLTIVSISFRTLVYVRYRCLYMFSIFIQFYSDQFTCSDDRLPNVAFCYKADVDSPPRFGRKTRDAGSFMVFSFEPFPNKYNITSEKINVL